MASPARTPPPEPAAGAQAPPRPPPSQLPTVDPSRLSPDNPAPASPPPAAPPTTTAPPPRRTGDSSPPSPPKAPTPPPLFTTDPSPPLPRQSQTSAPRPPPPPAPAPAPTPPPPPPPASPQAKSEQEVDEATSESPASLQAKSEQEADEATSESPASPQAKSEQEADEATSESPASPEAKSEQEADEAAGESENMTLALALTQTEETIPPPPKEAATAESPDGSPQKESDLAIAKLLSGKDPASTEAKPGVDKVAPAVVTGSVSPAGGGGGRGLVGSKRWLLGGVPEKVRRTELKKAELGFRVSAAVFCLVSLSVMAADTTPGWSGDSFRRYNEYRYTFAVSVMAFTYSGFQLVAEVHYLVNGRHIIRGPWDKYFNLAMDQILAYLVLSASSAALSRNDVWVSRFGVDQFAKLINASASMAFLAFIALGLSSIISAYHVFSSIS